VTVPSFTTRTRGSWFLEMTRVAMLVVGLSLLAGCASSLRPKPTDPRNRLAKREAEPASAGRGERARRPPRGEPKARMFEGRPLSDYCRDPSRIGLTSTDYSVVRAFNYRKWGSLLPPEDFLRAGDKSRVDEELGKWGFQEGGKGLEGLGEGLTIVYLSGADRVYRDAAGIRLIAEEHTWLDTLILSAVNKHAAKLVKRDLGRLRTESGIGLGDPMDRVEKLWGEPSHRTRYQFGGYYILWYVAEPEHHVIVYDYDVDSPAETGFEFDAGNAAALALKDGKVVEIWLYGWSTDAGG